MRHYVEVIEFKEGIFTRRYPPFFTKDVFTVFDKAIDQFKDKEAIVTVRDSNHVLIKAWGNVREIKRPVKPKKPVRSRLKR